MATDIEVSAVTSRYVVRNKSQMFSFPMTSSDVYENRPVCLLVSFCPLFFFFFPESSQSTLVSYLSYLRFVVRSLGNVNDGVNHRTTGPVNVFY